MDTVLGSELKVGDVVGVWWAPGRDTITGLRPYNGPLTCFKDGASLAEFACFKTGMTIEHGSVYTIYNRKARRRGRASVLVPELTDLLSVGLDGDQMVVWGLVIRWTPANHRVPLTLVVDEQPVARTPGHYLGRIDFPRPPRMGDGHRARYTHYHVFRPI